ncbi:MAG: PilN domain-containing protein [Gammaproteobacteria bacterium]
MRQQVNLLAPMYRKQRALFSARVSIGICLLVAVALTLIYFITVWRGSVVTAEYNRLVATRDTAARRVNELAAQLRGGGGDPALEAEVNALKTERDRKAQALAALALREADKGAGFSPQFLGLSRQGLNGMWLTHIELSGSQMTLQGVVLAEELIPRYLRRLGNEAVFAGTAFQQARLERVPDGTGLSFELRTQSASGPP